METEVITLLPPNGNPGSIPPWLQTPSGQPPMPEIPEDPKEPDPED